MTATITQMLRRLLCLLFIISVFFNDGYATGIKIPGDTVSGKQLFNTSCAACHSLEFDGIGPRLGGVTAVRSQKELVAFISDPEKVIKSGEERSVNLSKKYKLQMPSFAQLGEANIQAIITYIGDQTKLHQYKPLAVTKDDGTTGKLLPAIKKSGLKIDLKDFVEIPHSLKRPADKGIATLRPYPGADGTLFVSDQEGVIFRVSAARADTFLNVLAYAPDFTGNPGLTTGLGSFAFHPDFLHNRLFYTLHSEKYTGKPAENAFDSVKASLQWVLTEWQVDDVKAKVFKGSRRELWRINEPSLAHGVQEVGFVPGLKKGDKDYGLIYIGIGDGGSNNMKHPEFADNKRSFLGTIIRIDPAGHNSPNGKYGIPVDNPFINDPDPLTRKEIYAYGFRNPHRMAWDGTRATGIRMFVADIGESNIEEVNLVEKGGNYGWSTREGDYAINTVKDLKTVYKLPERELSKYKRPLAVYDHVDGNAISGGYVYRGPLVNLQNKYIFGDIVKGRLFYLDLRNNIADREIHEITLMQNGKEVTLNGLLNAKRSNLRIGYDQYTGSLYIMTKLDGMLRLVTNAYY